jgi:hypothetical protein
MMKKGIVVIKRSRFGMKEKREDQKACERGRKS